MLEVQIPYGPLLFFFWLGSSKGHRFRDFFSFLSIEKKSQPSTFNLQKKSYKGTLKKKNPRRFFNNSKKKKSVETTCRRPFGPEKKKKKIPRRLFKLK
jgi:hypothetical protein